MKCANVPFSVVPGIVDGGAENEIVFDFDIVATFCTVVVSVAAFHVLCYFNIVHGLLKMCVRQSVRPSVLS